MSEDLNPRELPHELLMRRYNLSIGQLSSHTKQLKTDLDRTLRLVLNKSKEGAIKLTPATQSKIETYDRYICDGIFEYLEQQEEISSEKADTLEKQAEQKREEVKEQMEEMHEEAKQESNESSDSESNTEASESNEPKPSSKEDDNKVKIGFWDWE